MANQPTSRVRIHPPPPEKKKKNKKRPYETRAYEIALVSLNKAGD